MRSRLAVLAFGFSVFAAAVAVGQQAVAPPADVVKVGKELKRTGGTVKRVEAGDAACYLTLADGRGEEFTELADFAICEMPSLIGKRVALTYTIGNVLADECQGNPDCGKSKKVALVSSLKVLPKEIRPAPGKPSAPARAPKQTSLCTSLETAVFSCSTGQKLVSVCASRDASRRRGYLQYRFGRPAGALELSLPEQNPLPPASAHGEQVMFSGGGGAWLRFENGPYSYVVYSGIGKWGRRGEVTEKEGIVVERDGNAVANLRCTEVFANSLGAELFERLGIETAGAEFSFPD